MFRPTSKTMVLNTVKKLYGKEVSEKCKVDGKRLDVAECKKRGWPNDTFYAELVAPDGSVPVTARSRDWRKTYKLLSTAVEGLYAEGKELFHNV